MYKSVFTVLIAVTMAAPSSWGQRQDDPVIKSVQKAYAQAEAQIAKGEEEQQDLNMMTVNVDQMWPGSGRHTETIKFYFTLDNSEEDFTNTLYLVRKTSRVAVREFLEEYLYDTQEAGKPLLCILTYYTDEGGETATPALLQERQALPAGALGSTHRDAARLHHGIV